MKKAVLSMDVEDWFHLDYFQRNLCDETYSMLDGLEKYLRILESNNLPSSFFVLGEIAEKRIDFFSELSRSGFDISSHGWNHVRPLSMSLDDFEEDLSKSKKIMKKINIDKEFGYRAPCFSLDRSRLDLLKKHSFSFSSSKIKFKNHPLYGSIDMEGYENVEDTIYRDEDFYEFELSTLEFFNKSLPICGGGYLRILPWKVMKKLITKYLHEEKDFYFYIHPFELSEKIPPTNLKAASRVNSFRFRYNIKSIEPKMREMFELIDKAGYEFTDFYSLKTQIQQSFKNED